MSPEERKRIDELCAKVQVEQDRDKFDQLVTELENLLERTEHRLKERGKHNGE